MDDDNKKNGQMSCNAENVQSGLTDWEASAEGQVCNFAVTEEFVNTKLSKARAEGQVGKFAVTEGSMSTEISEEASQTENSDDNQAEVLKNKDEMLETEREEATATSSEASEAVNKAHPFSDGHDNQAEVLKNKNEMLETEREEATATSSDDDQAEELKKEDEMLETEKEEATATSSASCAPSCFFVALTVVILVILALFQHFLWCEVKDLRASLAKTQDERNLEIERLRRLEFISNSLRRNCDVFYVGKCFRFIQNDEEVSFDGAQFTCQRSGWSLANLYDGDHYAMIADYLRSKIPPGKIRINTWLGMTINPKDKQIRFSSGHIASGEGLKWYPGYPVSGTDHTKMGLVVMAEIDKEPQGMHSWSRGSERSGVLCEI